MLPLKETVKKETVKDRGSKFMGKKIRAEEKARAAQMFLSGRASAQEIGETLGVHRNQIYRWAKKYEENGLEGLRIHYGIRYIEKNPQYSPEQKLKAVVAYQAGEGSQQKICERYGIRSRHALRNWIQVYNRHEDESQKNEPKRAARDCKGMHREWEELRRNRIEIPCELPTSVHVGEEVQCVRGSRVGRPTWPTDRPAGASYRGGSSEGTDRSVGA